MTTSVKTEGDAGQNEAAMFACFTRTIAGGCPIPAVYLVRACGVVRVGGNVVFSLCMWLYVCVRVLVHSHVCVCRC